MPASLPEAAAPTGSTPVDYLARARDLAPELVAQAAEIEAGRELPQPIRAALIEGGFFRLLLPRSLGGAELLPAAYVPVVEEIAKADASTAWCLNQTNGCAMIAAWLEFGGGARDLCRTGRHPGLGSGPGRGANRRGRLPADRKFQLCQRQSRRELARRACAGGRRRRHAIAQPGRKPGRPHLAVSEKLRGDDRYLACARAQRHRQRPVFGQRFVCAGTALRRPRRECDFARAGAALPVQQSAALQRRFCRRGARNRPQHPRRADRTGPR